MLALSSTFPLQPAPSGDILLYVQMAAAVFAALVGWPALLSTIVTALIYYGKLSVDLADTVMFWANALVFGGILVAALFGKIDLVNQIDATFGNLVKILIDVLILLGVPMGFDRAKRTTDRFMVTAFFQKKLFK